MLAPERLYQYRLAVVLKGRTIAIANIFAPTLEKAQQGLLESIHSTTDVPSAIPEIDVAMPYPIGRDI